MALRVLIFGSCVSRDIFNHDKESAVKLVDYLARSSFASAFAQQPVRDEYSEALSSPFQKRLVHADLSKEFARGLGSLEFDKLVIDLIDERFSLFQFNDGLLCTLSNELRTSGFDYSAGRGRVIRSGTADFYQLWEQGWSRFVEAARASRILDRVWINKVYWARTTDDGKDFTPGFTAAFIDDANRFLDRMYERISRDIPPERFLVFDDAKLTGASVHRWGLSPFHYVDDYYRTALRLITNAD